MNAKKNHKRPIEMQAAVGIGGLALAAQAARNPQDKAVVIGMIYETPDGQDMLKQIERNLGLALVPVEQLK